MGLGKYPSDKAFSITFLFPVKWHDKLDFQIAIKEFSITYFRPLEVFNFYR